MHFTALFAIALSALVWGSAPLPTPTPGIVLENAYARVSRNQAACAASGPGCEDRVLVALSDLVLETPTGPARRMSRGEVAVFRAGASYAAPRAGEFFEVVLKRNHPAVESTPVRIAPEKNSLLFDSPEFFVFEEKLDPGETRARHSHSQRVVVVINETRLQQWPDGAAELLRNQVPDDVRFNPPVVHVVKNVGERPLRNIVMELKGP